MLQVMIVDDMDIIRREIKRFKLWGQANGFEICGEANNGFEALQKLEEIQVDLILTDIKMPKIDGLELLQAVITKGLCDCVVLMSDYNDFSLVRQGLVSGAFDYMVKPVQEQELAQILNRAKIFIMERSREQEKIRRMEQELKETVKEYFSKSDVTQLLDSICDRNPEIYDFVYHMVDEIEQNLDNDSVKMERVLKNVLDEIVDGITVKFPWFDKFYDLNSIRRIDFLKQESFAPMKQQFLSSVELCVVALEKLLCCRHEGSLVDQTCKCVLEHIDEGVSLKFVADKLFLNKTYVSEAFKKKSGIPFVGYLTMVKMERAARLMQEEELKVYEIADCLGFKDVEYFSKLFKKYAGQTPTEYMQKVSKGFI